MKAVAVYENEYAWQAVKVGLQTLKCIVLSFSNKLDVLLQDVIFSYFSSNNDCFPLLVNFVS